MAPLRSRIARLQTAPFRSCHPIPWFRRAFQDYFVSIALLALHFLAANLSACDNGESHWSGHCHKRRDPLKKALCSIGHGAYEKLLAISRISFEAYAQQHGYDLVLRSDVDLNARPAPWAKVPLIMELLDSYDLVLWLDADAIIVDFSVDIADETRGDRWMYLARHKTGEGLVPNTGVWMMARSSAAKKFLHLVNTHRGFKDHVWWENAAVIDLLGYEFDPVRPSLGSEFSSGVAYLDHSWNSVWIDPAPHPRIKHYPALPLDVREQSLLADLSSCLPDETGRVTEALPLSAETSLATHDAT